jgi:hypothetical protein
VVVAEWRRGRASKRMQRLFDGIDIEPLEDLAHLAAFFRGVRVLHV